MSQTVEVVARTWARDSHDLFDFEAADLSTSSFIASCTTQFFRCGSDVQMHSQTASTKQDLKNPGRCVCCNRQVGVDCECESLLQLIQMNGDFWIDKIQGQVSTNLPRKLWLVVRDLPSRRHRLSGGDYFKLGRYKVRVHQMVKDEQSNEKVHIKHDESEPVCMVKTVPPEEQESKPCRICLLGAEEDDPLIAPCKCKGSIEYVHVGCLRNWINGRLNLNESSNESYYYSPLPCELCKAMYPSHIAFENGKREALVELPTTKPPFIVLESLVRNSNCRDQRGLHVISVSEEKPLTLGRDHHSDVRIADVSISRHHASIRFHKGDFFLEDNDSKFGTVVALRRPRALEPDGASVGIQVGRSVLSITIQPSSNVGAEGSEGASAYPHVTSSASMPASPSVAGEDAGERLADSTRRRGRWARALTYNPPNAPWHSMNVNRYGNNS